MGIAQINLQAGNLKYNANKIAEYIKKAEDLNLNIIAFPQNALMGFEMPCFIDKFPFILKEGKKELNNLAKLTHKTAAIIGFIDEDKKHSFAILKNGTIDKILKDVKYITSKHLNDGVEFFIKPSAIPSKTSSEILRKKNLQTFIKENKRVVIEINQVGAIDNVSYAGLSCAYDENGKLFARAKDFEEELMIINPYEKKGQISNSEIKTPPVEFSLDYEWDLERTYKTIVQGIRDYFTKCGLKRAVLGLSGGLDSTVCAVLLTDALGKENVFGVSMPSKLTSSESISDAKLLAENLGIGFAEASIKPMFETTSNCLNELFPVAEKYWNSRYKESFTPDNIQARSRAMFLWGISNEFEACIPIATSDKSEAYMGYATINGDMSGGFAPIMDVTKTKLFALARWLNKNRAQKNAIPESVILKKPGAELAIDPKTGKTLCAEDALMPYEFLDEIIWRIENKKESFTELMNAEFIYEKRLNISKEQKKEWLNKFFRRMSAAQYKSYIMPPFVILEDYSINKTEYYQPITSGNINYQCD